MDYVAAVQYSPISRAGRVNLHSMFTNTDSLLSETQHIVIALLNYSTRQICTMYQVK